MLAATNVHARTNAQQTNRTFASQFGAHPAISVLELRALSTLKTAA